VSATSRTVPNGDRVLQPLTETPNSHANVRPKPPSYQFDTNKICNIPQHLKDLKKWVLWNFIWREKLKKWDKPPFKLDGGFAKSNDPATWSTFDSVAEKLDTAFPQYRGPGFVLTGDLLGLDFDNVRGNNLDLAYSRTILELLGNPYCDVSPSGDGLKTLFQCPGATHHSSPRPENQKHYGIDLYTDQYFTVTGEKFSGDGVPTVAPETMKIVNFLQDQFLDEEFKKLWCGDGSSKYIPHDGDRSGSGVIWNLALRVKRLLEKKRQKVDQKLLENYLASSGAAQYELYRNEQRYRDLTLGKILTGDKSLEASSPSVDPINDAEPILISARDVVMKHVEWLWETRIAIGKITLFVGMPEKGKTLSSNWLTAAITTGRNFPPQDSVPNQVPPSDVLILQSEDDLDDTVVPRLVAAGADLDKVKFLEGVQLTDGQVREVRLDTNLAAIEKALTANPDIRLIIIDPVTNYLGKTSMIAEQEVRSVLMPLKQVAAKYHVAVVIIMHLNKKSDLEALSRISGAMAFTGVSRASWLFTENEKPEDEDGNQVAGPPTYSMTRIKNNLAGRVEKGGLIFAIKALKIPELNPPGCEKEHWTPCIDWIGATDQSADDALDSRRERGRPKHTDGVNTKAENWLEVALQNGQPQSRRTLIAIAWRRDEISERSLERAAKHLKVIAEGPNRERTWRLVPIKATLETVTSANTDGPTTFETVA